MEKRYDILSPDGIAIHPTDTYEKKDVLKVFEEWKKRYEMQGYYSSSRFGRIPLNELDDYCEVVEVEPIEEQ
jgi:hypothetical protein